MRRGEGNGEGRWGGGGVEVEEDGQFGSRLVCGEILSDQSEGTGSGTYLRIDLRWRARLVCVACLL
jgi:hypothetical protein